MKSLLEDMYDVLNFGTILTRTRGSWFRATSRVHDGGFRMHLCGAGFKIFES